MTNQTKLVENLFIRLEDLYKTEDRTVNNELIASYYESIADKTNNYEETAKRLRQCGRKLFFNEYERQRVNDQKKVFLCKDRFCVNCQRFKANTRLMNYGPILEKANEKHDLYMLTLTAENCSADKYDAVINIMQSAFYTFNRYLTGNIIIKGYEHLSKLGYVGSVRALETTFNTKKRELGQEYHPHIHAIVALSKNLFLQRNTLNEFSEQYKDVFKDGKKVREKFTRPFSELEIDIQRIWYLLMNDKRVTAKAINELELGYSCTLDKADEEAYLEVFKYAVKSFDDNNQHLEFCQFKTLLHALKGRKTIQGYGIFRDIKEVEDIDQEATLQIYDTVIAALNLVEKPKYDVYKSLSQVKQEIIDGDVIFINRRAVFSLDSETQRDMELMAASILKDYNRKQKKKYQLDPDKFFDAIRRKSESRRAEFVYESQQKKQKQRVYTERSKARTNWVKVMLKELGIDRTSPIHASTALSLKVEWNNLHPQNQKVDTSGKHLPF